MQKDGLYVYPKMVHWAGCFLTASGEAQKTGIEKIFPLQYLDDLHHENLLRWSGQCDAPIRPSVRNKKAVLSKLLQNLCQKMERDVHTFGHFLDAYILLFRFTASHINQCTEAINAGI